MRFLLFLGIIIATCFFGLKECDRRKAERKANGEPSMAGSAMESFNDKIAGGSMARIKETAAKARADAEAIRAAEAQSGMLAPATMARLGSMAAGDPAVPVPAPVNPVYAVYGPNLGDVTFDSVQFFHRSVPPDLYWAQWRSLGIEAVVDPITNVVVLRGPEKILAKVSQMVRRLDTVPGSCSVRVWAVYVDRSVSKGWDLIGALGAVLDDGVNVVAGNGALTLDVDAGRISAALEVIADGNAVELLQQPHVRLQDGEPAKVEAIQEIPIPQTVVSNGVAQSSIVYRKVGLQLNIKPQFKLNGRVVLAVDQANGLVGNMIKIEGSEVPTIESQTVSSTVEMAVGQAIVLGGVRTLRHRVAKGLLRDKEEVAEGSLYVILATYNDEPRALPVIDDGPDLPPEFRNAGIPGKVFDVVPAADWIDGQLLPPRDWEAEERDLIRAKSEK